MSSKDERVGEETMVDLLRELKRSEGTGNLAKYNRDVVDRTILEINSLYNQVQESIKENNDLLITDRSFSCAVNVHSTMILRHKRLVLAYLRERMNRIQELRWELGAMVPADIKENLSEMEVEYLQSYDRLLGEYMGEVGVDICADPLPPLDLLIEVRALEDHGEIFTSIGVVNLEKNTTHFLPRSDVEGLIRRGVLQHII